MLRGSTRYDEILDASSSADASSSLSEIDLLNPRREEKSRVRRSDRFSLKNSASTSSNFTVSSDRSLASRRSTQTKLPPNRARYSFGQSLRRYRTQQQVTFADIEGDSRVAGPRSCDVRTSRKGKGTPRIIRAIRHHSERLNVKNQPDERSPTRILTEENSKSSVVVLYHGERKKSPASSISSFVSSAKPPIRLSKSERTIVTVALPERRATPPSGPPVFPVEDRSPRNRRSETPNEPPTFLDQERSTRDRKSETPNEPPTFLDEERSTRDGRSETPEPNSPSGGRNYQRRKLKIRSRYRRPSRARRGECGGAGTAGESRGCRVGRASSEKSTRSGRDIEGEEKGGRARCREAEDPPWPSKLMAQRSASPREVVTDRRRGDQEDETLRNPRVAFFMQHMQQQQQQQGGIDLIGDIEDPSSGKRVFPFQSTASGNLKIIPNQVVFESKKVSVLVADPRHTKVNVKADLGRGDDQKSEASPAEVASTLPEVENRLIDFCSGKRELFAAKSGIEKSKDTEKSSLESGYVPRTQPYRSPPVVRPREMEQNQVAQAAPHRLPLPANEVPLSSLGFTGEQPIDWDNIILPEKTDLYRELARRITNYKNADCIVRLGHDEFHCHLLVLQSYSTYFDEKNYKEVDLTGSSVTSKAFSIIYDWMISPTSDSCHLLRRDNILEIFMAAQQLGIKELEEQCWAFIDNDELFSEDTAFLLYLEARKIGNTAVMELMVPRIMKFFLMLVSTKDFLELSVDELCLLLRSNYICVNSEMEVLMSAVRWLMHDWQARRQHMMQVLKCVRFGLIAPWQLVDVKRNPENPEFMELMSYPEVQKMVDDGLAFVIIKYWYGNQTEDYYHWIDLLGLTEPTNRNWAGEDKNYVTYREFLLYLEEYQRTKMPELKNRKTGVGKTNNDNAASNPPTNPPPPPRVKMNSQANNNIETTGPSGGGPLGPLLLAASSNLGRSSKYPRVPGPGVGHSGPPGGMAMPPELLGHYLSSFERNAKGINRKGSEVLRSVETTPREIFDESRLNDDANDAGESPRRMNHGRDNRQWTGGARVKNYSSPMNNGKRNCLATRRNYRDGDSSRSEEDAATAIQALYRGYKARRRFTEIRKSSSEERQKNKSRKVAELLAINVNENLHKPLEPVRMSASLASQGRNEHRGSKIPRRSPSPRKRRTNNTSTEGRASSTKDLEGIRFDVTRSEPVPQTCHNDPGKSIQTIHCPRIFHNFDEKASSVSQYENTDTEPDPFSPRTIERRSSLEIRTCDPREIGLGDSANHHRNLPLRISDSIIGGNAANDYYGKDSLFFGDRESVVVFGGLDPHQDYGNTGNTARDIYRFKPSDNEWEFVGEMPEARHHHSVVYLKGRIYLVGGADPRDENLERKELVVGTVWSYDPTTRVWFDEPAMLTARKDFGLVVSGGKMYAIGGQDKNGLALRSVEAFDPSDGAWREMRSMCTARIGPAAAKYRELIWVGGGMTKSKKEPITKEVECYDPLSNLWLRGESLRSPRCLAAMYVVCDTMYVIGGASKTSTNGAGITESIDSVDVWDQKQRLWRQHGEISIARHGHAVGSVGDQLLVIGGLTTIYKKSIKSVECYCCQSAKSIKGVSSLPYALSGHDSVSLPAANFLATN